MDTKPAFGKQAETFAKPPDADAVQGVAAQRVQTYHTDRQTSEQRTTQKCAADGGFAKVSGFLFTFIYPLGRKHKNIKIIAI
ncbi:hypothetical protein AKG43_02050 [Neisseria sp. 74A18]|nr:hypothetical protein AKG43_02050 [Neisseria sp. 74A18]